MTEKVNSCDYKNIFLREMPEPVYCYRSGLAVYEERFLNGTLVSGGWNAAGYPLNVLSNFPSFIDNVPFAEPTTFHVELDGETVDYMLEIVDFKQISREDGFEEAVLTLSSKVKPVEIKVHTLLDGTSMLTRWLEICNLSEKDMALSRLSVFSGALQQMKNFRTTDPDAFPEDIYEIGYFDNSRWGSEGQFVWKTLPFDKTTIAGRFLRDRFRHPLFFLKNKVNGQFFFGQLGWSAGYEFAFDYIADHESTDVSLGIEISITGYHPLRLIGAGETFVTPQVHIGTMFGTLDDVVNASYDHIRRSVLNLPEANGDACLVGSGMGAEHDMSLETSKRFMDQMAEVGCELFIVDGGWNCPPNLESELFLRTGNWHYDKDRYPGGIEELVEYAHSKGMKFGLWMEVERAGEKSTCYQQHPEWVTKLPFYDCPVKGFLDFTNPEVVEWAEAEIVRVITEYKIDLFRIDYNVKSAQYFYLKEGERLECGSVKHYEEIYAMYERLKKRFPNVIFENCAGGGGRTDLAMLRSFNHTWVSDWQRASRSLYITSGMTLALPPERVDRLVAGMWCHEHASLDFQMRNAMLGHMTLNVFSPAAAEFNTQQLAFIKHSIELYKNFIRPFLPASRMYHHNPDVSDARKKGYLGLELVSADRTKAAIGIFTLPKADITSVTIIPRGLDVSMKYSVTFDNTGDKVLVSGWDLVTHGIKTRSLSTMTSELILIEAVFANAE